MQTFLLDQDRLTDTQTRGNNTTSTLKSLENIVGARVLFTNMLGKPKPPGGITHFQNGGQLTRLLIAEH